MSDQKVNHETGNPVTGLIGHPSVYVTLPLERVQATVLPDRFDNNVFRLEAINIDDGEYTELTCFASIESALEYAREKYNRWEWISSWDGDTIKLSNEMYYFYLIKNDLYFYHENVIDKSDINGVIDFATLRIDDD